jgi:glycosyltransferase involved in cell wall biosynthesis
MILPKPAVSIIIPVFNVEKYLRKCLDSVLSQTFYNFECILVDDYSPDNSSQICDEYAEKDSRFKIINKPANEGLPLARKTGFENSLGDYIMFIDSDDWMESNMIEKLYVAAMDSCADIVSCDVYKDYIHDYEYIKQDFDTKNIFNNLGFVKFCSVCNKLFRREIVSLIDFPQKGNYEDRVITQQAIFY